MSEKRLIWTVIFGAAILTGYRALKAGDTDPIQQLAGIGAAGVMLLFLAEVAPKFASSFAVLLALTFALNYRPAPTYRPLNTGANGGGSLRPL